MKILKLTLLNLASLEGEQVIDFEQEPLKSSDLFSITGATGSGKSTILDAICLALYGFCPRFKEAGKVKFYGESDFHNDKDLQPHDPRNILSRGTKRCFSELLFEVNDGGLYQARWSCEVGRTNYQKPVRKLYKLEKSSEGKLLEKELEVATRKGDNEAINRLIGLDYGQFVRTVILAQGSFANFIKADDKEKALLLEKLTGTEIYTTIAKKIYEFYKQAADQYVELEGRINQMAVNLLADQEYETLLQESGELEIQLKELTDKQKVADGALLWWNDLEQLQRTLVAQELLKREAEQALLSVARDEEELALWDKITPIQGCYTKWQASADNLERVKLAIQEAQSKQVIQAEQQRVTAHTWVEAKRLHEVAKEQLEERAPIISKAKVAKATLDELATMLTNQERELQVIRVAKEEALAALRQNETDRLTASTRKELAVATLKGLAPYQSMLEDSKVIGANLKESRKNQLKEQADGRALELAKKQQLAAVEQLAVEQIGVAKQAELVAAKLAELNQSKSSFAKLNLESLQQQLLRSNKQLTDWKEWYRLGKEQVNSLDSSHSKETEVEQLKKEIVAAEAKCMELLQEKSAIEKVLPGLEEGYRLAMSASSEAMRASLVVDEPCPVCGATNHPYAHQNVTELLSPLKVQIRCHTDRLKELEGLLTHPQTGLNSSLQQARGRVEGFNEVLKRLRLECKQQQEARLALATNYPEQPLLHTAALVPATFQGVASLLVAATQQVEEAAQAMESYRSLQNELNNRQTAYDEAKSIADEALRKLTKWQADLSAEQSRIGEQEKAVNELRMQLVEKRTELRGQITLAGWESLYETHFEGLLEELRALYTSYTRAKEEEEAASGELKELAATHLEQQKMVEIHQERELRYQAEVTALKQRLEVEMGSYCSLLNGADPFEVERQFKVVVDEADKQERHALQLHREATEAASQTKGNYDALLAQQQQEQKVIEQLREEITLFVAEYNQVEGLLLTWETLQQLFNSERDWVGLRKRLDEFKQRVVRCAGMVEQCTEAVTKHQAILHKPTAQREELLQEVAECKVKLEQIDQSRQQVNGRLMAHKEAFQKVEHYQEELKEKRRISENWKLLNDILGNKDGDNFRETAQIYTLQFLLKQANAQLTLLTNRYRLEQVNNSLSIRIVDKDRADEVRNLSSLSGGETFLVSLSLALGLSSLSSRNISIQNLFVDEGFGTLDAESLSVVIDALSSLHALQGKKVGVISHTAEMRERIQTQIKVVKQGSGGRSLIEIV
ncbi:MAG: AAA family ATPase [Phocaeicola sp.]